MRSKFAAMSVTSERSVSSEIETVPGEVRAVARDAVRHLGHHEHGYLALEPLGGAVADADRDQRVGLERRVRPVRLGRSERQ